MDNINWQDLTQIPPSWFDENFYELDCIDLTEKLQIKVISMKFTGNQCDPQPLSRALSKIAYKYVFGKKTIEKKGIEDSILDAAKYFGKRKQNTEGKYGELLLFGLVESYLRCPMIANKMPSSFSDQIKGSDGIFVGDLKINERVIPTISFGESKIWKDFNGAMDDALKSISRFHDEKERARFLSQEYIVCKSGVFEYDDLDPVELFNILTIGNESNRKRTISHPVLVMYDEKEIRDIELQCFDSTESEAKLLRIVHDKILKYRDKILSKVKKYDVDKHVLFFFIIPSRSIDEFRYGVYYDLHGVESE